MKAYTNVNLVTCDSEFHVYREGLLVVEDDRIAYCGPYDQAWLGKCSETVDYGGAWIMPGLVNCHTHSAMTLLRGIRDDSNLHEWLENYIWPAESQFTAEVTTKAVQFALAEMLLSGTTTFNDMYNPHGVDIKQVYQVVRQSGMRCYFSPTLFTSPAETVAETLARTRAIIEEILSYDDEDFQVMVAPHSPYACDEDLLQGSVDLARELDLKLHIHVAETQNENKIILERYGKRPLAFLKGLGYLERPAIFAHGVELNPSEISDLAISPVSIAHNPISNLKLASGVAPVTNLLAAGVTVGLATDSVASNNNLDMFEEGRTAALLQKMREGDASQFTIDQALKALTIEGAKALGLEDKIGSLEVGKQADFIAIQPKGQIHLYPLENMLSHLVYAVKGSDVQDVYIAGRQVVRDGQVLTVNVNIED
ncbi:TRZ/ATZ family protein [Streptococcus gordonii]|uniref:TRZ/ATZ family protein n=1 Tax=Streptococcus gordonii TaxID=1302 RepID=UPI001CC1B066|nr:TRZ/ATZ family protein [Streptococcus gordonii]MBZ2132748.1 TRZ/ATZ family protein [Streptococcus gordonii]MBZ2141155.1 TRZ/ATZ family protein [Streptococcus gordonii]MBZ2143723.1 TRZ/ATZ family protein [Streptococcus gordonii]MBZ2145906.1 TRZ/ATZ family protein [Streptococcus gordonii]